MEDIKKKLHEILEKTECMASRIKEYDTSKMTTNDFMEAFDLMKDTAMTMSYLAKAKYYDTVVDAMEHGNYVMTKEMYDLEPESWKKSSKKYYTETMTMLEEAMKHYDDTKDHASLENMLNHIAREINDRTAIMDVTQKNLVKTKMANLINSIR